MGGDDAYPAPLEYFAAGVGTRLMTQVARFGRMLKVEIRDVRVRVRIGWEQSGSVFAGTVAARCTGVQTDLDVDADASDEMLAALIHSAKASCFAEAALVQAVPLHSTVTRNGVPFPYTDFPAKPPR